MKTLFLDTETRGVQYLYDLKPREQFRLGQWAWGRNGEIHTTPDYDEFMSVVEQADLLVGHNIFYDTTVMWGKDSMIPLEKALHKGILDTFNWYPLRNRIPAKYERRDGKQATTYQDGKQKPELVKRFLSLDNLTYHHGLPGKLGNLVDLAKKYNPEGTPKELLDFGLIPQDDPDFLAYAIQDIVALQALASFLLDQGPITPYEWREMLVTAINDQMQKNGVLVDVPVAEERIEHLKVQREEILTKLVKDYDFPSEGKSPWASNAGKEAIVKALADVGITPKTRDWPRTPKGALKMGGEDLINLTEGTDAAEFGKSLAILKGQRSLAQLALDEVWKDGRVHPEITSLQRSGRFSMTKPSLPIWGAHGDLSVEKEYFIPSEGHKFLEMDLSNADQRIVAALSGDEEYAKRFLPGVDGHEVSGRLMFGDSLYDSDPSSHRTIAKALSHAYAYGAGVKTLARTSKLPDSDDPERTPTALATKFVKAMDSAYPWNKLWRSMTAKEGETGWITNDWGRIMPVDVERSWTQAPGLLGQSGTREILMDGLIRIAHDKPGVLRWLVATIHDAVLWDIPEEELEWVTPYILNKMQTTFIPKSKVGQPVDFIMSAGEPADNWRDASHE